MSGGLTLFEWGGESGHQLPEDQTRILCAVPIKCLKKIPFPSPFVTMVKMCCAMQYDDGKLEDLLKEVAGTEIPADAPTAPSNPTDEDIEMTDVNMLPSQRSKCNNKQLPHTTDDSYPLGYFAAM